MNLTTFLAIDASLMLIGVPLLMILKGKKINRDAKNTNFTISPGYIPENMDT